ncbi:MAG TPA: FHA domain-containing protein [Polyangiaceae bacterium]|nr:FHA domain-containing protein [Polyangiaceae bacterium]
MTELILSLRERELGRFPIVATRTTIGREPGCDIVIDNAGISRLHALIEVVGDSFVLRDSDSENGVTLNGEACREGRLVHGDVIGLNKFLLRFSNQELEVPANLQPASAKAPLSAPKDVQRTMHVDARAAQALQELAKKQIARQRAEAAAREGASLPPLSSRPPPARPSLGWDESASPGLSMPVLVSALMVGAALIALLIRVAL